MINLTDSVLQLRGEKHNSPEGKVCNCPFCKEMKEYKRDIPAEEVVLSATIVSNWIFNPTEKLLFQMAVSPQTAANLFQLIFCLGRIHERKEQETRSLEDLFKTSD